MARKKKETEFEKLARLIKEEGEDIRGEIKEELGNKIDGKIDGLARRMDDGFTRIDRKLDGIIQP